MVGSTHWVQKCPMKITNLSEQKSPNKKASHHFWNSISMLILYVSGEWCCTFNLLNVWVLILYVFWWMMLHLYLRWWCLLYHLCSLLYSFLTDNIAEIELGHKNYTRGWIFFCSSIGIMSSLRYLRRWYIHLNENSPLCYLRPRDLHLSVSQWESYQNDISPLLIEAKRWTFICVTLWIIFVSHCESYLFHNGRAIALSGNKA